MTDIPHDQDETPEDDLEDQVPDGFTMIELEDSEGPDVRFAGKHLGGISTKRDDSYRWSDLDAYRSAKGLWVIHERNYHVGQDTRCTVAVFTTERRMLKELGYRRIYMKLWREIGIKSVYLE